jgi:hypothetical protein
VIDARRPLELERLRHIERELLRSRDLRASVAYETELLWWHQRALHDSFGVASGLAVDLAKGGEAVVVAPGVAFDCYGRELRVSAARTVSVPDEVDDRATLLARFAPDRARASTGACDTELDEAELVWSGRRRLDPPAGVPLAVLDSEGSLTPAAGARVRPFARPRVAAGATRPDGTPWQAFSIFGAAASERAQGLEVRIDISPAGFTSTPCCFAWLQWPRLGRRTRHELVRALALQFVERPGVDAFTFRIWTFLGLGSLGSAELVALARREQLWVSWLAVECQTGAGRRLPAKGIE